VDETYGCFTHYQCDFKPANANKKNPFQTFNGTKLQTTSCCVSIKITTLYDRAIYIFKYEDIDILQKIRGHFFQSNLRALEMSNGAPKRLYGVNV